MQDLTKILKIGDIVFIGFLQKWGIVESINSNRLEYPIMVRVSDSEIYTFTIEGYVHPMSKICQLYLKELIYPILHFPEPKPEIAVDTKMLVWDWDKKRKDIFHTLMEREDVAVLKMVVHHLSVKVLHILGNFMKYMRKNNDNTRKSI